MGTLAQWQKELETTLPDTARALVQETLSTIILSVGGIYLVWFFFVGLQRSELLQWRYWVVFIELALITSFSIKLHKSHTLLAESLWLAGIFVANILSIILFEQTQLVIFFMLLPFIAVILIDWWAGLCMELIIIAIILGF
ncbi:MAG: hypothetical protein E4H27_00310, partial [Anaerolineales bacterium]